MGKDLLDFDILHSVYSMFQIVTGYSITELTKSCDHEGYANRQGVKIARPSNSHVKLTK